MFLWGTLILKVTLCLTCKNTIDCEGKDPQKELYVYLLCVCAESVSHVQLFATPWTVARQISLSMEILHARILD